MSRSSLIGQIVVPSGASAGDGLHVEFDLTTKKGNAAGQVRRLIIQIPEGVSPGQTLNVTGDLVLAESIGPSRLNSDKIEAYAKHFVEENSMSVLDMLIAFLDLAENIFTVFAFSSDFSFGAVLTTFLVIDLIKAEARAFSTCCLRSTVIPLLLLVSAAEVLQAIAYMYFCEFSRISIIFCAGLAGIQIVLTSLSEVYAQEDYIQLREKMAALQSQLSEDEAQKACISEFCNHCFTKPLAIGVIAVVSGVSFAYTASDSPFQSLWFQVLLTFYVWFLACGYEWMLDVYYKVMVSEEEIHRGAIGLVVVQEKLPYGLIAFMAYGLVLFAISVDYYKTADYKYDYVLCIFSLIGGSCIFCFVSMGLCMLCSSRPSSTADRHDQHGMNDQHMSNSYLRDVGDMRDETSV